MKFSGGSDRLQQIAGCIAGASFLLSTTGQPPLRAESDPPVVKQDWGDPRGMSRQQVIEKTMLPFRGESHSGVDTKTLHGKVMSGYQGWFCAPGDGSGRGWTHWEWNGKFEPGFCKIDLWPDVSELAPEERRATAFKHADGSVAEVFSSFNRETVLRHFKWMRDYSLDGVFVQRFITQTAFPTGLRDVNVVLDHCREGANLYGRTYGVMYDLSGLGGGQMERVMDDWKLLVDRMKITSDPAYIRHNGKPVVVVWGFGFNDRRRYTVDEGLKLVEFLKHDPQYGNCTVMLGVPAYWRTLERDSIKDETLHKLIESADIVSPWTVGRFTTPEKAAEYAQVTANGDMQWCQEHHIEFMPVVFPGFSWHNMFPQSPHNQIPRLKGKFLWSQYAGLKKGGATMVYQAMFDEVDEGTAIFKCSDNPPAGASKFLDMEGLPSDFYLRLVGKAARMISGATPVTEELPSLEALKTSR